MDGNPLLEGDVTAPSAHSNVLAGLTHLDCRLLAGGSIVDVVHILEILGSLKVQATHLNSRA